MYDKGMAPGTRINKKKITLFLLSFDLVLAASLPVLWAKPYLPYREERQREWKGSVADPDPGYSAFFTPGSGIRDG